MESGIFKKEHISATNIIGVALALFGAFLVFPTYIEVNIFALPASKELWMSLDPSWTITLNYANLKHLSWGEDIAFTYGPLSYLCTKVGWGENRWSFLLFDIFLFCNYAGLFFISFRESKNKIITVLLILLVCLILPLWINTANAVIMLGFLVFWIRKSIDRPMPVFYLFQIALLVLLFFIKFNTGLIAFPLFYAGIAYNIIAKNGKWFLMAAYALVPVLIIMLLSGILNVALGSYISSGFNMVEGYNEIMYLDNQLPGAIGQMLSLVFLLVLFFAINTFLANRKDWLKHLVSLLLLGTSVFVLYKQAFVRADVGHIRDFFIYLPVMILCNTDLHKPAKNTIIRIASIALVALPFYYAAIEQHSPVEIGGKLSKAEYFAGFSRFTPVSGLHMYENAIPLPDNIKAQIGDKTVDIYPWNCQLLLENKLNYLPRPVIQSYTAYTPSLEQMNFERYNAASAPEFVIYDYGAIDGRYPLFDEPKMNLALLRNYSLAATFDYNERKMLLLQKKKDFRPLRFEKVQEYAMMLNSRMRPQKDIYYEVELYTTFSGKKTAVFEHAPEVMLEIQTDKGQNMQYRTSLPLLRSGIFMDKFIGDTETFKNMLDPDYQEQAVKNYNFRPLQSKYFKDKIKITEYKIIQ